LDLRYLFEAVLLYLKHIEAWTENIANGKPNPDQSPEQLLGDLEFIKKIPKSGERKKKKESLTVSSLEH